MQFWKNKTSASCLLELKKPLQNKNSKEKTYQIEVTVLKLTK